MKKCVLISIIISVILVVFFACNKLPCDDITCYNKSITVFDTDHCYCNCLASTRGEFCEINLVDSLSGNYEQIDSCNLIESTKQVVQVDTSHFNIVNLGNYVCSAGDYTIQLNIVDTVIKIDSQQVCGTPGNYLFFGKGSVNYITKKLNIKYYVSYFSGGGNQIDTCKVYYNKM